ncbi:MAG TPA: DUF4352 domain-containing protein, partial [Mycobacteriales bacterium]
ILIAVVAVFALIAIGNSLGGGGDKAADNTNAAGTNADAAGSDTVVATKAADKPKPAAAKIGTEVRDGKFAFTVTKVQPGLDHVGEGFAEQKAQGEFVLVHVTVKNIGDEAQLFDASSQTLVDTQGRQYDADSGVAAIALADSNSFLNNINPGNSVAGILVYDVPKGLALSKIELHDSMFSGGVTVTLSR